VSAIPADLRGFAIGRMMPLGTRDGAFWRSAAARLNVLIAHV
jgi:hypothetical protein